MDIKVSRIGAPGGLEDTPSFGVLFGRRHQPTRWQRRRLYHYLAFDDLAGLLDARNGGRAGRGACGDNRYDCYNETC
jgi:hypothetical protein